MYMLTCIYKYIYKKSNNWIYIVTLNNKKKMQFMSIINNNNYNNQSFINIYMHDYIHTTGCRMPFAVPYFASRDFTIEILM